MFAPFIVVNKNLVIDFIRDTRACV